MKALMAKRLADKLGLTLEETQVFVEQVAADTAAKAECVSLPLSTTEKETFHDEY